MNRKGRWACGPSLNLEPNSLCIMLLAARARARTGLLARPYDAAGSHELTATGAQKQIRIPHCSAYAFLNVPSRVKSSVSEWEKNV
jgi:hypothetical protein